MDKLILKKGHANFNIMASKKVTSVGTSKLLECFRKVICFCRLSEILQDKERDLFKIPVGKKEIHLCGIDQPLETKKYVS